MDWESSYLLNVSHTFQCLLHFSMLVILEQHYTTATAAPEVLVCNKTNPVTNNISRINNLYPWVTLVIEKLDVKIFLLIIPFDCKQKSTQFQGRKK